MASVATLTEGGRTSGPTEDSVNDQSWRRRERKKESDEKGSKPSNNSPGEEVGKPTDEKSREIHLKVAWRK